MILRQWIRPIVSIGGLIGTLVILIKPILWLVSVMGDIEFIATNLATIGKFLDTGWGTVATVLSGSALIAYSAYHGYRAQSVGSRQDTESEFISRPTYETWDDVEGLTVLQAACLWADIEPVISTNDLPRGEPYARFRMLKEAINKRELKARVIEMRRSVGIISGLLSKADTIVTRTDLREFAGKRSARPLFLFPDKR